MIHKNKILVITMALYFLILPTWFLLKGTEEYSDSERRKLQSFPEFTARNIFSGEFTSDLESYMLDQFPMRAGFRTVKAYTSRYLLGQKDNNGIYQCDGYIGKMEYPLNKESIEHAKTCFRYIYDTYLSQTDVKVYYSMIPDKNYYLAQDSGHLSMDYEQFFAMMQDDVDYMEYIDIVPLLSIEDYYMTDTHWRQEKITEVAKHLTNEMGTGVEVEYEEMVLDHPFYGVYYGQLALPHRADTLHYLNNETLDACKVYDYQNDRSITVYDMDKATGRDPYEMFLSGSLSLVTIENPNASTDKELILFRDSFGSSIAPLLVESYAKITLVDIRYISSQMLGEWISFEHQDVLFLYSTQVLNNSETMR